MGTQYRQARPSAPAAARPSDRRPLGPECRSNRAHHPHQHRSRRLGLRAPSLASRHQPRSSRPDPRHNPNQGPGDRGAHPRLNHRRGLADPNPGSKRLLHSSNLKLNTSQDHGGQGRPRRHNHHRGLADPNPGSKRLLHSSNPNHSPMANPKEALGDRGRPRRHNHHRGLADPSPDGTPSLGWPRCTSRARPRGLRPESSRARRPYPRT